ncbi:hypothetical protein A3Q56_05075 [Intoshia linei]|uniref:Uncharacterized protein n=1 Tax=Intoshia linei TaxID=1819745 RepID=A0A177B0C9_9BILA|nr:hypothetical protein A3Q56_05075 [Intoshia linei]
MYNQQKETLQIWTNYLTSDILTFFKSFENSNNLKWDSFIELWKEMKFFKIFKMTSHIELNNFCRLVMLLILPYLEAKKLVQNIFGIYLAFATIKFNQDKIRLKIPITPERFKILYDFFCLNRLHRLYDPCFIYCKLYYDQRFELLCDKKYSFYQKTFIDLDTINIYLTEFQKLYESHHNFTEYFKDKPVFNNIDNSKIEENMNLIKISINNVLKHANIENKIE